MPLAAQYSTPETKGKNVGIILSGLLTGILASRVVSGIVGEYMGWRFIYFIAAGLMVVCLLIIIRILPDLPSNYQGSYAGGMQCIQLSNQTSAFALCPQASNRINTIFMTTYFIGGSTGTFLAGTFWQWFGWTGVVGTGILLTSCSLLINIFAKK
jgi:predicted MFS family arabinose efflux permease